MTEIELKAKKNPVVSIKKKLLPHTYMYKRYLLGFLIRCGIFALVFSLYIINKEKLSGYLKYNLFHGITALHILWLFFMTIMATHLFPSKKSSIALHKAKGFEYEEKKNYSRLELLEYTQKQNYRAWLVMLVWLSFNSIFGILFLINVLDNLDMLMLTVFYFLCDYICILFFCPFQSAIMKNKCCINCRIYDWGHFMMFTPMLFIRDFFSWSLFFTSLIVLIRWELYYARHPERFWEHSNLNLQCANCKEKLCRHKYKVPTTKTK